MTNHETIQAKLLELASAIEADRQRFDSLLGLQVKVSADEWNGTEGGMSAAGKAQLDGDIREAMRRREQFAEEIQTAAKDVPNKEAAASLLRAAVLLGGESRSRDGEVFELLTTAAAAIGAVQNERETPSLVPSDSLSLDERAVAAKVAHPEWSDKQVAAHIGCGREALFKPNMVNYKLAKKALAAGRDKYRPDSKRPSQADSNDF